MYDGHLLVMQFVCMMDWKNCLPSTKPPNFGEPEPNTVYIRHDKEMEKKETNYVI